ncbi:MAG: UPF0104 family protein [Bacteroidetes bacterium]|nr:MAG: UPF0104 family protein [Bacteroidota bacterium]
MSEPKPDILKRFKLKRILWPVFIGLAGTIGIMVYKDLTATNGGVREALAGVHWTVYSMAWIALGLLLMAVRDLAYTWRMRILTEGKLNWKKALQVTLLWEFSSALTPSVVGGSAVAVFMLVKEKLSIGKSTGIVFTTILLDELFYVVMLPLVLLFVGHDAIFAPFSDLGEGASTFSITSFWIAYSVIAGYTLVLILALIVWPYTMHRIIKRVFMLRLLQPWRRRGFRTAEELLKSSREFNRKPLSFWLKGWTATVVAWMARYLILNCVLSAFAVVGLTFYDHVVAFARQAVMFIAMIVSPTPGSAGIAEFVFTELLEDLTPLGLGIALAAIWRLITYYPYFIIGPLLLPRWLKRVYLEEEPQAAPPTSSAAEPVPPPPLPAGKEQP